VAKPVFVTNDVPPASQWNDWMVNINWARKTVSEDVTSSAVLQDDDQLVVPVTSGAVYRFEAHLNYDAPTAAGITIGWTVPAGAVLQYSAMGPSTTAAAYTDDQTAEFDNSISVSFGAHGVGTRSGILLVGALITSATPGNVQLRWCQRVSNATRTRMFAHSYLDFMRRE